MAEDLPDWAKAELGGSKQSDLPDWAQSALQEKPEMGLLDRLKLAGNRLLGTGGQERYQLFPEVAARAVGSQIQKFIEPAYSGLTPGSREITEAAVKPAAELGLQFSPLGPESRIAKAAIPGKSVIPPERQSAVDVLKKEGIDVSAGQARGSQPLRTAESALGTAPFSGDPATEQFNAQMRQFTKAALRRVGEDSDRATPEVIDRAFDRIGNEFNRLEEYPIAPDEHFANEITRAKEDYVNKTSLYSRSEHLVDIADRMAAYVGREMPGQIYKSARSELTRLRRGVSDPNMKQAITDYVEALDGAAQRSLAQDYPEVLADWNNARRQYRNMLVIEKALPAGEAGAEGLITPAKLRQAALSQDKRQFRRGKSDFSDLALAGEQLLTPVKTSKTSERATALAVPAEIGAAGAAALSGNFPVAGGALAALFGPGIGGRILMNPRVQEWLKRQKPEMSRSGTIPQELVYRSAIADLLKSLGNAGQ